MSKDVVREIRRATKKRFSSDEKIRVVLEGLRGSVSVKELCRRENITTVTYYKWSKAFLDSGKNGLTHDTKRDATSDEVRSLKDEVEALKRAVAEQVLENQRLKKSLGL